MRTHRGQLFVLAVMVSLVAGCGSSSSARPPVAPSPTSGAPAPSPSAPGTTYYVALGDSLSVGLQPDAAGTSRLTDQGYPDALYATIRPSRPGLRLVKLGCSGEKVQTMTNGGTCRYPQGSQLGAATAFLRSHPGSVALVTIDMGANDVDNCATGGPIDPRCVTSGNDDLKAQLPQILEQLRSAAGPSVRIVGLNMYDPYLARSLNGARGRQLADASLALTTALNATLAQIYAAAGDPLADVAAAFATNDSTATTLAGHGTVPLNVARVCQWTWMCAPAPVGPNIHPNATGYQMMAGAVAPLV